MQFSLRTLHVLVFGVFCLLLLAVVLPMELLSALTNMALELTAVGLLVVVVYGRGRLRAFAVGGLAAIVIPWLHGSSTQMASGAFRLGGYLYGGRGGLGLGTLLWLVGQVVWIAGCGWLAMVLSGHVERLSGPKPPPVGRQQNEK